MSEHNYILYGAGELGEKTLTTFINHGMHVSAVIDQKKRGVLLNTPIYDLKDIKNYFESELSDFIVLICLNAGTLHKEVAENLFHVGFRKIVFLPISYPLDFNTKVHLTKLFNMCLSGVDISKDVQDYEVYRNYHWAESAKIDDNDSYVTAWIGEEIFFSEDKRNWHGDKTKINSLNERRDFNLNSYSQMHNLFDYLDGKTSDYHPYISSRSVSPNSAKIQSILEDRSHLYHMLNENLSYGLDFFIEAAPDVSWNKHGYFNIIGGNHRTIFLQHQGWRFYPAKMAPKDYAHWLNNDELVRTQLFIKKHNIQSTYTSIPHPCFLDFPSIENKRGDTTLAAVLRFLGPIWLENKKILDMSQYEGCFSRTCRRLKAADVVHLDLCKQSLEFSKQLARLLHITNIDFSCDEIKLKQISNFDIIFAMQNAHQLLYFDSIRDFKGMLFIEFPCENQQLVDELLEKSGLSTYTKLSQKFITGCQMEVGVLTI